MPIVPAEHWLDQNRVFVGVFVLGRAAEIVAAGDFGKRKDKREPQQWTGSSSPVAAAGLGMSTAAGVAAVVVGVGASVECGGDAGSAVVVHSRATGAVFGLHCWNLGRPLYVLLGDIVVASLEVQEQPWTSATDKRKREPGVSWVKK